MMQARIMEHLPNLDDITADSYGMNLYMQVVTCQG